MIYYLVKIINQTKNDGSPIPSTEGMIGYYHSPYGIRWAPHLYWASHFENLKQARRIKKTWETKFSSFTNKFELGIFEVEVNEKGQVV